MVLPSIVLARDDAQWGPRGYFVDLPLVQGALKLPNEAEELCDRFAEPFPLGVADALDYGARLFERLIVW
jgi:hypothetical protein